MAAAVTVNRTPISRPARPRFSDAALDLLAKMKRVRCTCPPFEIDWRGEYWKRSPEPPCWGCQQWDELHSQLCDHWPGYRPWFWPVVADPEAPCPYPEWHAERADWMQRNQQAIERWLAIDAALRERARARRRARRAVSQLETSPAT
jgi:hypothetical protein